MCSAKDWESMWAPYDDVTYQEVLKNILCDDIVLDIGAGDLRLSREIAKTARFVYALEIQGSLIKKAAAESPLPKNLVCIAGDARLVPFPQGVTVGVLLMRHCSHFQEYVRKLQKVGAQRLITNARWRLGVEVVQLPAHRAEYSRLEIGWYACLCGATGFKQGPAEQVDEEVLDKIIEVKNCPNCSG